MTDFDSPMDSGPQEPRAMLPWESIDPDEPASVANDAGTTAPQSPHGADHDWAATVFLDDEFASLPMPMASAKIGGGEQAADVVDPDPEAPTPWTEMEPVMAEIATPAVDEEETASTFARTDAIIAAASELATLAVALQTSASPKAEPRPLAPRELIKEPERKFAATASPFDLEPPAEIYVEPQIELEVESVAVTANGGWTIPLMCLGIGLIACCVIIPQGDFNRRLHYEQDSLQTNLKSIEKQAAVNEEFLKKVGDDPELAERLSGRQLKTIRKGQKIIPLDNTPGEELADVSPFGLVAVAPPPAAESYRPARGTIADLCNNARARLYVMGTATMMVAVGLVMGFGTKKSN